MYRVVSAVMSTYQGDCLLDIMMGYEKESIFGNARSAATFGETPHSRRLEVLRLRA